MSTIDVLPELMEVAALLVTVALTMTACRQTRLACLGSLSIRLTLVLLVLSVLRDDWMIGLVAVINLITGDAGLVLLAKITGVER